MENIITNFERAQNLQNLLITQATGGVADNAEYQHLREYFLDDNALKVCTTIMD